MGNCEIVVYDCGYRLADTLTYVFTHPYSSDSNSEEI